MREKIIKYFDNILIEKFNVMSSSQEELEIAEEMAFADDLDALQLLQLYQRVLKIFGK